MLEFWNNIDKIPSGSVAKEANRTAKKYRRAVYDSLYVAAAIKNDAPLHI
jgi:predicted nucleic acid-binding protein